MYNVRIKIQVEVYMTEEGVPIDEDKTPTMREATIALEGYPSNIDRSAYSLAVSLINDAVNDRSAEARPF